MAIRVSCSKCGTVLDVPEHAAGKAVACPACKMKVFVPNLLGGTLSVGVSPPAGGPGNAPYTGTRAAGGNQGVQPQMPAFRPAPQPAQQPARPPEMQPPPPMSAYQTYGALPQPLPMANAPAYPAAGQPGPWQPTFIPPALGPTAPQTAAPRYTGANYTSRSRGFFANPWVVTLICLVLLGGLALLVWWLYFSKAEADVAWLPDNPDVVAQVRVADLFESDFIQELERKLPEVSRQNWSNLPGAPQGVDFSQIVDSIDTVTIGVRVEDQTFVARYHLNRPLDIKGLLQKSNAGEVTERQASGRTLIVSQGMAWCEVEDDVMLFGPEQAVADVLERGESPSISSGMKKAMGKVDYNATIAVAVAVPPGAPADGLQGVYGEATFDDELVIDVTIEFESSSMAGDIARGMSMASPAIKQFGGDGIEEFEVDRDDEIVTISATINASVIDELKKILGQFMGPGGFNPEQLFRGL